MRVFLGGRGNHPSLAAALQAWNFAQTSNTDPAVSLLSTGASLDGVGGTPGLVTACPVESGRSFDGDDDVLYQSDFPGDDNLNGALSCLAWVRLDSGGAAQTILGYFPYADGTKLWELSVDADNKLVASWEETDGTPVTASFAFALTVGQWINVGVIRSSGVTCTCTLYVNGTLVETVSALAQGARGGTANDQGWCVGARWSAGGAVFEQAFAGAVCSAVVWASALTATDVEDAFWRGMLWRKGSAVHWLVKAEDQEGNMTDVSSLAGQDWLQSVTLRDNVDAAGRTATVKLTRSTNGADSLAPYTDNRLNQDPLNALGPDEASYTAGSTEFLQPNRDLNIYAAREPWGIAKPSAAGRWNLVLAGVVDQLEWAGEDVVVEVQDKLAWQLTNGYQEAEAAYSDSTGDDVEHVMQDILDDAQTAGWIPDAVTLWVPTSPDWAVKAFRQRREPILEALNTLAEMVGWVVKTKLDPEDSTFKLALYDPDRTKVSTDAVLSSEHYDGVRQARLGVQNIRNVVRVVYPSLETSTPSSSISTPQSDGPTRAATTWEGGPDSNGDATAASVTWQDATSVARYGRRFFEAAEGSSSQIDTITEADRMALAMLRDLKDPTLELGVDAFPFPEFEVGDRIRWKANDVHFTEDKTLAVTDLSHTAASSSGTTLSCRGNPSGGCRKHLAKESRTMGKPPVLAGSQVTTGLTKGARRAVLADVYEKIGAGRSSRHGTIRNPNFQDRTRWANAAPDGWEVAGGTWGTDLDVDTTTARSGKQSIKLLSSTGKIRSDLIPVEKSTWLQAEMVWSASSSEDAKLVVEWYQADGVTAASTATTDVCTGTTDTAWLTSRGQAQAPSNARWARVRLERSAGATAVYFDRVNLAPLMPRVVAYRNLSDQSVSSGVLTTIAYDTEEYNNGITRSGGAFTIPQDGVYSVQVSAYAMGMTVNEQASIGIYVGGAIRAYGSFWVEVPKEETMLLASWVGYLNAGDAVTTKVYLVGTSTALNAGREWTSCAITMLTAE